MIGFPCRNPIKPSGLGFNANIMFEHEDYLKSRNDKQSIHRVMTKGTVWEPNMNQDHILVVFGEAYSLTHLLEHLLLTA